MNQFTRRSLLVSAVAAPLWAKKNHIGRDRISTITDENAKSPAEALAFVKQYGLQWVELRNVPGDKKHYIQLTEPELKQAAKEFKDDEDELERQNNAIDDWANDERTRM